uniref:ADP-ribosylation factor-related protein 1 n=1 Tax=Panagrellus redivivus TaxID=6233 RepID=A0A7E4UNR1_PANRE
MTQKEEYFITILGLDDAGKTTLLERIKAIFNDSAMVPASRITPTIGMNIGKVDHRRIRLNFWDVGGQAELQTLWDKYIDECHAIIFVIDASTSDRIAESLDAFRKVIAFERVGHMPLLILFNKCDGNETANKTDDDSETDTDIKDATTTAALDNLRQELADTRDNESTDGEFAIMSVSAIEGANVERSIKWLAEAITRQYSAQA